jgi:hypothetical protein
LSYFLQSFSCYLCKCVCVCVKEREVKHVEHNWM